MLHPVCYALDVEMICILALPIISFVLYLLLFMAFSSVRDKPFNSLRLNVKMTCKWFLCIKVWPDLAQRRDEK